MPKLTAIGEVATSMTALPKDFYKGFVCHQAIEYSKKGTSKDFDNGQDRDGCPMVCLNFEIDEGDYKGRKVPPSEKFAYRVMLGGLKEDGSPHDLGRLFATINALKADWTCGGCGRASNDPFLKEKGHYHCPSCGVEVVKVGIGYDTDQWVNLRCRIQVDIRDIPGFEEPMNEVKGLRPITD
jgi:hypothetical protein